MAHILNIDLIVLFFFLGVFARWIKTDLDFPDSISKFLSIYLLLSLGLKGGHEVRMAESLSGFSSALSIGLAFCILIPLIVFYLYKKTFGSATSAALAACFGSVSAVTFIAARGMLENENIPFNGYMVAVMALMEIPAIVVALFLYQKNSKSNSSNQKQSLLNVLTCKSVVLLIGGFLIGLALPSDSWSSIEPVVKDSFKGILAFFLLDLGLQAQPQISQAWKNRIHAAVISVLLPLFFGTISIVLGAQLGLMQGDNVLLATLVGSASYIAAPAAIRTSILSANSGIYGSLPIAVTFPINIVFGIPYYLEIASRM